MLLRVREDLLIAKLSRMLRAERRRAHPDAEQIATFRRIIKVLEQQQRDRDKPHNNLPRNKKGPGAGPRPRRR